MTGRFAVKRLVPVEIDPARSHQHEFHAGRLRVGLGFGDELVRGRLRLLIYRDDYSEPAVVEDEFTLYDARADNPRRSEWHLYYRSNSFTRLVRPDDLLVLYRPSSSVDLHGVVVAPDTDRSERLLDALMLRDDTVLREFRLIDPPEPRGSDGVGLALTLASDTAASISATEYPVAEHPLVQHASAEDRVPLTRTMAAAAAELAGRSSPKRDPDLYLARVLEAESALYFAIESAINGRKLQELQRLEAPVAAYLDWAMATHQARRSRRGQSLQLHFATILVAASIPFDAQCVTEAREIPDFVFPGCSQYHDPDYPAEGLRMVACKSTSKERWRQILKEAERVPEKYLVTLDPGLTPSTITQMRAAGVRPFLPATTLARAYSGNTERRLLGSVAELLSELAGVIPSSA